MESVPSLVGDGMRVLGAHDVERLSEIDRALTGRQRRHFFDKRMRAAARHPEDFVHIGVARGGALRGFALAHVERGEFGRESTVGVLDALGVEPHSQELGLGQTLLRALTADLRRKGARTLHSEAGWADHDLMRFFDSAGFVLAPRMSLERSVAEPLPESIDEV